MIICFIINKIFLPEKCSFFRKNATNNIVGGVCLSNNCKKEYIMKKLLVVLFAVIGMGAMAQNPKPFIIPELTEWTGAEGELQPSGRVAVKGSDKELMRIATVFAEDYKLLTGRRGCYKPFR